MTVEPFKTSFESAPSNGDAYAPADIARRVETVGVAKATRATLPTLVLATLAGAFIALGALFYVAVMTGSTLGFGPTRLLGGIAFSLGLILVIVGGAELFTGNNLLAMAWASRLVTFRQVFRNWALVYLGNAVGAFGTVVLVWLAGIHHFGNGSVQETLIAIGRHKTALDPISLLALGILCNALVCLAVWLAFAGRSVVDKTLAIIFPIAAFVTVGAEHSIANLFFLPYAMALDPANIGLAAVATNIALVTVGNILGGTLLVAAVYWLAYRPDTRPRSDTARATVHPTPEAP